MPIVILSTSCSVCTRCDSHVNDLCVRSARGPWRARFTCAHRSIRLPVPFLPFLCAFLRSPLIGCKGKRVLSLCPPTTDYRDSCEVCVSFLSLSLGPGPGAERHTQSAHHGSYPRRLQRLPAEHSRHRGRAAPLPPGAELGDHISAAPIRDPRCYGIASSGLQRGDLITPDWLSARGKLRVAVWASVYLLVTSVRWHTLQPFTAVSSFSA